MKEKKRVVILVDNKKRDLPGAALLAYHLEKRGIECFLQPLGGWRASLAAFKPHFILFNHLLGSHLVQYSRELHRMGVKVGVLPNEGILYNEEVLEFNASKFHNDAHIDHFFVWNEAHKRAIEHGNNGSIRNVHVVGVPRFDFYFEPLRPPKRSPYPTLLVCSNFVFAQYKEMDPDVADRLFAPWKDRVSSYRDYWSLIETNHRSRAMFLPFLETLAAQEKYHIIFKPHPGEDAGFYDRWYAGLDETARRWITLEKEKYIWELIPQCDAEIACETCTTTLESWICQKPTIELLLTKHPVFYHDFLSRMTLTCEDPSRIVQTVEQALGGREENRFAEARKNHLAKWCDSPDGHATEKLATIIADSVANTTPDFSGIDWKHRRKGLKLRAMNTLGFAYNFNPAAVVDFSPLPKLNPEKIKYHRKNITPSDVETWKKKIEALMARNDGESDHATE